MKKIAFRVPIAPRGVIPHKKLKGKGSYSRKNKHTRKVEVP